MKQAKAVISVASRTRTNSIFIKQAPKNKQLIAGLLQNTSEL